MLNPKAGENRLVPDIRPEHIETITENYTFENGEEQTAEYKIFNVDGIVGGILNKFAFWHTHAKAVWYNKLANRTVADEIIDLNAKIGAKIDLEWKKIGSGALQARVNLPVEFNEILAICDVKANSSTGGYSVIIPRGEIADADAAFYAGSYFSVGYQVMFSVNTGNIKMSRCMQGDNNVSGAKARYYYR